MKLGSLTEERKRVRDFPAHIPLRVKAEIPRELDKVDLIPVLPTAIRANEKQVQSIQSSQSEIEERQLQTLETFFIYRSSLFLEDDKSPIENSALQQFELPHPDQDSLSTAQEIEIEKKTIGKVELFREIAEKTREELFVPDSCAPKSTESFLSLKLQKLNERTFLNNEFEIEKVINRYETYEREILTLNPFNTIDNDGDIKWFYRVCKKSPNPGSDCLQKYFNSNPAYILLAVQDGLYKDTEQLFIDCLQHKIFNNPNFTLEIIASAAKQGLLNKTSVEVFKALGFSSLSEKVIRNYDVVADLVASSFIKDIQRPKFSIEQLPCRELKDYFRHPYPRSLYRAIKTFIQKSPIIEAEELEEIFKYVEANFGKTCRKDLEIEAYGHGSLKTKPRISPEDILKLYELKARGIGNLNFLATAVKYGVIDDLAQVKRLTPGNNAENDDLYQEVLIEAHRRNNSGLVNHFKAITSASGQHRFIEKLLQSGLFLAEKEYHEIFDSYIKDNPNKFNIYLYNLLSRTINLGLIKDQNYLLKILRQCNASSNEDFKHKFINGLIVDGVNNDVLQYDRAFLEAIEGENQRSKILLPTMAAMKIEQLKKDPKTRINFDEKTLKEIQKVFIELQTRNLTTRNDQKIDVDRFMTFLSASVVNLYAIDSKLAKNIIDDVLYQRKNPQMTRDTLLHFANLTLEEINVLREFTSKHGNLLKDNPHFLGDVAGYLQAFKNFGIDFNTFTSIVTTRDFLKANQLSGELALELIQSISSNKDLGIEINIDKVRTNSNFLKDWDFRYLGNLMSSANTWTKEQRKEYGLILKSKFEGTEAGLVSPEHYSEFPLDVYGDSAAQEIAENIRVQNLNLLREAEGYGVNIPVWLNAHDQRIIKPIYTLGRETQRKPEEIIKDFRAYYKEFKKWFEKEHLNPQNLIYQKFYPIDPDHTLNRNGPPVNLDREIAFWQRCEATNQALINSKNTKEIFTRESFNEFALNFGMHFRSIKEDYEELLPEHQLPEAFWDMDKIYQEMCDYNFNLEPESSKNYRIRFLDPKDIGHLIFMGNRANSCTAFGRNSNAVFGFARHLGTKYLVIEDTSSTIENPNGNVKGYIRVFLGINDKDQPVIYYDTIDGSMAGKYKNHMEQYLNQFAAQVGLPVQERDGKLIDIIGGAPNGYFNHGGTSAKPLNPGPRVINDIDTLKNWIPKNGWTPTTAHAAF